MVVTALVTADTVGLSIFAEFESPDNTPLDTLQLFDDGAHNDGSAGDSIFGNTWSVPATEERNYFVDLQVTFADSINLEFDNVALFTSIGPVVYESFANLPDSLPNPFTFSIVLRNEGLLTTAGNVRVRLSTSDSCVENIGINNRPFGDIDPGASATSSSEFRVLLIDNCVGATFNIEFDLSISSDGTNYWTDNAALEIIIGVEGEISGIPTEYSLSQSFPNPFNPTTTIEYSLPNMVEVSLIVYNLLGEEVTRLISENQQAGYHKVTWDASSMASGIYLYRLTAGDFVRTRKMVLLK